MSPRYGFNFQWMFVWNEGKVPPPPDLDALDLMAEVGLDFVRIPTDYRFWTLWNTTGRGRHTRTGAG